MACAGRPPCWGQGGLVLVLVGSSHCVPNSTYCSNVGRYHKGLEGLQESELHLLSGRTHVSPQTLLGLLFAEGTLTPDLGGATPSWMPRKWELHPGDWPALSQVITDSFPSSSHLWWAEWGLPNQPSHPGSAAKLSMVTSPLTTVSGPNPSYIPDVRLHAAALRVPVHSHLSAP